MTLIEKWYPSLGGCFTGSDSPLFSEKSRPDRSDETHPVEQLSL